MAPKGKHQKLGPSPPGHRFIPRESVLKRVRERFRVKRLPKAPGPRPAKLKLIPLPRQPKRHSHKWSVFERPPKSKIKTNDVKSAYSSVCSFEPDVPGKYTLRVRITNDNFSTVEFIKILVLAKNSKPTKGKKNTFRWRMLS